MIVFFFECYYYYNYGFLFFFLKGCKTILLRIGRLCLEYEGVSGQNLRNQTTLPGLRMGKEKLFLGRVWKNNRTMYWLMEERDEDVRDKKNC